MERLEDLPDCPFLPNIYVKRDDLTGCTLSGNKVRKLEFCLAEALSKGADTVITCGGVQSNHSRAAAVAASKLGLKPILVLRGEEPGDTDGNLLIDRLAGADIRFITPEEWERVEEIMAETAEELAAGGGKAYIIPEGASYPPGVFAYIRAAREIADTERELGVRFDTILTAVGSGGTYAGLAHGLRIYGMESGVLGVNVLETPEYFAERIARLSEDFIGRYGASLPGERALKAKEVEIAGGYEGPAYAVPTEEGLELIRRFASRTGLFLDPTYTGKAMLGLFGEARKGRWSRSENVLFLHTGGIFSLFPLRKELFPEIRG